MKVCHLDFETRSECDLKKYGAYVYAADPSTKILCMAYAFGDAEPELWIPDDRIFPSKLMNWIADGGLIAAHNAQFERLIFKHVLGITIPPEQFICTASLARARGLPGRLALAPAVLGAVHKKDSRGGILIRECCVPPYNKELLPELYAYCIQDVRAERELCKALPPFTQAEQDQYASSERVNDRGIKVDVPFCRAATRYRNDEVASISQYLSELTNGEVTAPTQSARILNYLTADADAEWTQELRSRTTKTGYSTGKAHLEALLERDDVPFEAREVAQCRLDGANVSVSKYKRMAVMAESSPGERIRGAFMFNPTITGRFSSRGVQLHNFKRSVPENYEDLIEDVMHGVKLENVMSTLASLLRPSLIAGQGKVFVGGDWSGIEARITPWFADEPAAERVLDVFRSGRDVYVDQAIKMGYTEDERQIGKVAILACGFGGTGNAFATMARAYGLNISKNGGQKFAMQWQKANPWAKRLWDKLEDAAKHAISRPGVIVPAGRVRYMMFGDWLCCQLPSGRVLYYPQARLHENQWGKMEIGYVHARFVSEGNADKPPRVRTWGGKLCENIVQAAAADLLRETMVRAEMNDLPVVGHVHDELLCEVPEVDEIDANATLYHLMVDGPGWAAGLPLDAEVWSGFCYQK